jgi:DnaJ-class molecular chaperone
MTATPPPPQCQQCRGKGYLWGTGPRGEWPFKGECDACHGSGSAPAKPKREGEQ